jgi:PPM family protein phosphatase
MITCPECGQAASDDAKFCDRCGRGLSGASSAAPPPTRPSPLVQGTVLKGQFEILELAGQSSIENRYRARRVNEGGKEPTSGIVALRERFGPEHSAENETVAHETVAVDKTSTKAAPPEDPNGPRAKTAELNPARVRNAASESNGVSAASGSVSVETTSVGAGAEASIVANEQVSPSEANAPQAAPIESDNGNSAEGSVNAGVDTGVNGEAAAVAAVATEAEANQEPTIAEAAETAAPEDMGEVFGRVLALSQMITHPAFQRALAGFSENGRVYLVYADELLTPIGGAAKGVPLMSEPEAIATAVQICQAISFLHRKALRLNDLCPESVAIAKDGRLKLTGLDYVSNDNELQAEPIFNDGYTAPEIYRSKKVDKRADIFSAGAILYTWLTGERIPSESWREEPGPVRFYPPHVITPKLEQAVRRAIAFSPADRWPTIDEFKAELIRLSGAILLQAAAMTDVGRVREHNEDSVLAVEYRRESLVEPAQSYLYVVADGMGGAEAGEIASAIAVKTVRDYVESGLEGAGDENAAGLLSAALEEANSRIIEYVATHPESRGMGSTGVAALLLPPNAAVAWVGDSRAYLMEGATLRQITKDHSLVQRLVEIGQITADEARSHEHKNVITRSLGARQSGPAGAESFAFKLKRGDKLLLCSDGLTAHLEDSDLHGILFRNRDPHEAARELIVAANAGGGTDNISVVVVFAS